MSELTPLPFTPEDLKIALKTAAEGQKVLRTSLNEAKAAKAKAKGKESPKKKSKQPTDTAEAPKRKRGKTTPWEASATEALVVLCKVSGRLNEFW